MAADSEYSVSGYEKDDVFGEINANYNAMSPNIKEQSVVSNTTSRIDPSIKRCIF